MRNNDSSRLYSAQDNKTSQGKIQEPVLATSGTHIIDKLYKRNNHGNNEDLKSQIKEDFQRPATNTISPKYANIDGHQRYSTKNAEELQ